MATKPAKSQTSSKAPRSGKSTGSQGSDAIVLPRKLVAGIQTVDLSTNRGTDIPLPDAATYYGNTSIAAVRTATDPYTAIRALARISGDFSMALASYIRLANTPFRYKVFDSAHQLSPDGMIMLRSWLSSLNHLNDYTYGYDDRISTAGLSEILLGETLKTGACSLELVLDKARLPFRLQPVSPMQLRWRITDVEDGPFNHKITPWQQLQGATIMLDIPTFFFAKLDADPTVTYPKPPMEPAINAAVFHAEVLEDIRRAVRRSGHSRLLVTIDSEKLRKAAPLDVRGDPAKLQTWMEEVRASLETQLAGLNPESGLVLFDTVTAEYLNSEIGASADYGPLMELVDGQAATALRTPPAVLGKRIGGSQNTTSTESLLFIKHATGIRQPAETVLSRAYTLAMRLLGFDGYVEVKYTPIELRTESELEAFKLMKQQRILELLSDGFLTDQEAAEELDTGMMAPGAPPLSGTGFYRANGGGGMDPNAVSNGGDPTKRAVSGNTPSKAGGKSQ